MKRGVRGGLSRYACKTRDLKTLHDVGVKIQQIKTKVSEIFHGTSKYGMAEIDGIKIRENRVEDEILRAKRLVSPDCDDSMDVISFDDYRDQIVEQLIDPENQLLIMVSIVGMGGIGKSNIRNYLSNILVLQS